MNRVLYIPYTYAEGRELRLMAQSFKSNSKHRFVIMHHKSGLNILGSLGPADSVYVLCHYAESVRSAIATLAGDSPMFSDELAKRIEADGLKPTFGGKVKLFACEAGKGDNSFAKEWANYMRNTKHYNSCQFYGYSMDVAGPATHGGHKLALDIPADYTGDDYEPFIVGNAKQFRVPV